MHFLAVNRLFASHQNNTVLHGVELAFPAFQRVAIAGETGSGKTSLLKAIAGLIQPDSGEIRLEGERVPGAAEKLLPGHPRIAYLSQHFELRNNYRVDDYLEMASRVGEAERQRIYQWCQIDHLLQRRTDQLSGGERQRTALARLLTTAPRLLLLDEPYSNLDGMHKQVLKTVIENIVQEGPTSCIMVSHDPADVLPWAETIVVLKEGRLVQQAPPKTLYQQPLNEYAGALFGDYNLLTPEEAKRILSIESRENRPVFIRPENIHLQPAKGEEGGRINAVHFFGSYCELELVFPGKRIWVKQARNGFQKGDRVLAGVETEGVWWL